MPALEKYPLSVVILTKNEEKRLGDCLRSISWARDIVILDDGSTDQTKAVAEKYETRFFERVMDVEGRHRNYGYSLAKEEWVLSLDADERVTPELSEEIKRVVVEDNPSISGYSMLRRNYIKGHWVRYGGWYAYPVLKMFRKDRFLFKEEEVHPVAVMNGPVESLKGDIIHYSYKDFSDFVSKLNHQTTLEAQKWFRTGRVMTLPHALRRTVDRFFRSWILKKGYRDGFVGFVVALFAGFYQILSYAKYWEMKFCTLPHN